MTEVIVRIGDWEHECCGEAVEVNQIVESGCLTLQRASGEECLVETHRDREPDVYVRGRVSQISVVDVQGAQRSIVRVPADWRFVVSIVGTTATSRNSTQAWSSTLNRRSST